MLACNDPNLPEYNYSQPIINSLILTLSGNQFLFRSQFSENIISEAQKKNVISKVTGKHESINDNH